VSTATDCGEILLTSRKQTATKYLGLPTSRHLSILYIITQINSQTLTEYTYGLELAE